jgi:hypothetical protein
MRWEYLRVEMPMESGDQAAASDHQPSGLGHQGWELVSVLGVGGDTQRLYCWLKRQRP